MRVDSCQDYSCIRIIAYSDIIAYNSLRLIFLCVWAVNLHKVVFLLCKSKLCNGYTIFFVFEEGSGKSVKNASLEAFLNIHNAIYIQNYLHSYMELCLGKLSDLHHRLEAERLRDCQLGQDLAIQSDV